MGVDLGLDAVVLAIQDRVGSRINVDEALTDCETRRGPCVDVC